MDLESLLARDHADLENALDLLLSSRSRRGQTAALEAARLGFAAHAEAESNVLHRALVHVPRSHPMSRLFAQTLADHATQEVLLLRLAHLRPYGHEWLDALHTLRAAIARHHRDEHVGLLALLSEVVPSDTYMLLAASYATERLRALAMMTVVVRSRRDSAHHVQTASIEPVAQRAVTAFRAACLAPRRSQRFVRWPSHMRYEVHPDTSVAELAGIAREMPRIRRWLLVLHAAMIGSATSNPRT